MLFGLFIYFATGEIICDCDLSSLCDFNCCCDTDCTSSDKTLFSGCQPVQSSLENTDYCTFSKVVQSQNEVTESATESSSSYCIKIDNNKDRLTYSSAEISTKEKLEEHIKLLDAKIDWASNQVQFFLFSGQK